METYISTDIETDGPIPGDNSMLSIGSAAYVNGRMIDTFYTNLDDLPDATPDANTMKWWESQPEAWEAVIVNRENPMAAMQRYYAWVHKFEHPVFVGHPAGFDFTFVYWYFIHFLGKSPYSFSAIDMKTYVMAKTGKEYRKCTKSDWPKEWKTERPHTHNALDDAIEQGDSFMLMLNG